MFVFTSNISDVLIVISTVLGVLIFAAVVVLLIMQYTVTGYFSNKKFAVKSKHTVEPLTGEEKFELMVFNNNVNEARVLSFGFFYRSNSVDFFETYIKNEKLPKDIKLIITSRDFIKLEIEAKRLQDLIEKHNDGKIGVAPVYGDVTDVAGNVIKYPAREVRRIVYRYFKAKKAAAKEGPAKVVAAPKEEKPAPRPEAKPDTPPAEPKP